MKWEYKILETGKSKGVIFQSKEVGAEELNKLGEEGWELVTSLSVSGAAAGFGTKKPDQVFFIFKRSKSG